MAATLVIAGLSAQITVWDPGVFEPTDADERTGADVILNAGRERGVHAEIGGYLVVARRQDTWDAITQALTALDERHPEAFHQVMRGCRRLSNSGREFDGLDDLLSDAEQVRFDLSLSREERRDRIGYLPPEQARAFLDSARRLSLAEPPDSKHVIFAAYQQRLTVSDAEALSVDVAAAPNEPAADSVAVAGVVNLLRDAGVLADAPRALLAAAQHEQPAANPALHQYLHHALELDGSAWAARQEELTFLANALISGCSVQSRPFTERHAIDAVAATCNLGLECWPPEWPSPIEHDLLTVFEVGWTILYRDVSMAAADRVLAALDAVQSSDQDLQFGLHTLRRELRKQRDRGTPWRACEKLEALSPLDLPTWAALTSLFDECPVMLSNVWHPSGGPRYTVNPAEFQFIGEARHVAAVDEFLHALTELLV
jgi:hypothetical protein